MIKFYRRFIRGAASILKLLTDATKGGGPKHRKLDWQPDMEQAFKEAKVALSDATILAHPPSEPELSLAVNASNHHVGGVLQQKCAAGLLPLAFLSRKLNGAETKYSTLYGGHPPFLLSGGGPGHHTLHWPKAANLPAGQAGIVGHS